MIFLNLIFGTLLGVHIYNITDYKKYKKTKSKLPKMYINKRGDLVQAYDVSYLDYLNLK
jgi:hypothetical protein